MEENLQQLFHIRPLQEEVLTYRTSKLHRRMMKQLCIAELKLLTNVEMNLAQAELQLPNPSKVPPISSQEFKLAEEVDSLLEDYSNTLEGWNLLNF